MGGGAAKQQVMESARINEQLMGEYARTGEPIVRGVLDYAREGLKTGLPAYAERAYAGAQTSALEATAARTAAGRAEVGGSYGKLRRLYEGSADALASENAKIQTERAVNTVSRRNSLLSVLFGQGAQATNLGASFGQLTLEGLSGAAQPSAPLYGGLGALGVGLRAYLEHKNPGTNLVAGGE